MRRQTWGLALMMSVLLGARTAAGGADREPTALGLEINGTSQPAIQPYTELTTGQTISLATGIRLVFLQYETCRAVRVVGGTLTLRKQDFTLTGGRKESDQ